MGVHGCVCVHWCGRTRKIGTQVGARDKWIWFPGHNDREISQKYKFRWGVVRMVMKGHEWSRMVLVCCIEVRKTQGNTESRHVYSKIAIKSQRKLANTQSTARAKTATKIAHFECKNHTKKQGKVRSDWIHIAKANRQTNTIQHNWENAKTPKQHNQTRKLTQHAQKPQRKLHILSAKTTQKKQGKVRSDWIHISKVNRQTNTTQHNWKNVKMPKQHNQTRITNTSNTTSTKPSIFLLSNELRASF